MESAPIGSITVFSRTLRKYTEVVWLPQDDGDAIKTTVIRCVISRQRFIKVSHHGNWRRRWVPYCRYWWEQSVSRIPPGYWLHHLDGDSENDTPNNLVLCRSNRFAILFQQRPQAKEKQRRNQRSAVRRANKRRHAEIRAARAALFNPDALYVVFHDLDLICWKPFPVMHPEQWRACFASLQDWLARDEMELSGYVDILKGREIRELSGCDGPFESYRRWVPDERVVRPKQQPTDFAHELLAMDTAEVACCHNTNANRALG